MKGSHPDPDPDPDRGWLEAGGCLPTLLPPAPGPTRSQPELCCGTRRSPRHGPRARSPRDPVSLNCRLQISGHRPLRGQARAIFFLSSIKPARKQRVASPICSENLGHLPLGDRAVARETPPWENRPGLIVGGGQAGDIVFFLTIPWGQLLPLDLKKLRKRKKRTRRQTSLPRTTLSPPMAVCFWMGFLFLHFVFPPAQPRTVCRSLSSLYVLHPQPQLKAETLCLPDSKVTVSRDDPLST